MKFSPQQGIADADEDLNTGPRMLHSETEDVRFPALPCSILGGFVANSVQSMTSKRTDSSMEQIDYRFALLIFQPRNAGENFSFPILILERNNFVEVHVASNWEQKCDSEDREYLAELMEDWKRVPPGETSLLIEQLSELSIGPLLATKSGTSDEAHVSALRDLVLEQGPLTKPGAI
ncbi:MAG TPA: hypothetical protein VMD92_03055 [Acidobacteriaceae bacterium]|nr:hypothetical protein [Acidobacteriaceae bacterium]